MESLYLHTININAYSHQPVFPLILQVHQLFNSQSNVAELRLFYVVDELIVVDLLQGLIQVLKKRGLLVLTAIYLVVVALFKGTHLGQVLLQLPVEVRFFILNGFRGRIYLMCGRLICFLQFLRYMLVVG